MPQPDIKREREFHDDYFADHSPRKRENQFYDQLSKDLILNEIFSGLSDLKNKKVLYYGCGENLSVLERFYLSGTDVVLFDLSEVALVKIHSKHSKAKLVVADAHRLPFLDSQFDLIFGRGILHHLEVKTALTEIKRILSGSGEVIFIEPLGINPLISLYRALTPQSRTTDEQPFRLKEIRTIRNSFPSFSCQYYFFTTLVPILLGPLLRRANIFEKTFLKFHQLDKRLFQIFPFLKYLAWITVLKLSK